MKTMASGAAFVLMMVFGAHPVFSGIQIDLPELLGEYSLGGEEPWVIPSMRSTGFVLPDSIATIEGLRLVASGPWFPGLREQCRQVGGQTYCDTIPYGVTLVFRLTSDSVPDGLFYAAEGAYNSIHFDHELLPYGDGDPPDFNLLVGSEITADLYCNVPEEQVSEYIEATHGEITGLSIETIGAVPVQAMSWSGVKALYR